MLEDLIKEASQAARPARYPSGYHSAEGDCLFVYNEGGEYTRQRVDDILTVFRAPDDARIIGLQIKGVTAERVLGVEVTPIAAKDGKRVDAVTLLLKSLSRGEGGCEPNRISAYRDAFALLGARALPVELQVAVG